MSTLLHMLRAQATGLIVVILLLGTLLAVLGGSVRVRVRDPVTREVVGHAEVNKFLQRPNLDTVLKNSSWIAIMAVGATILIVCGGIDLSIGAIYCLSAVSAGMILSALGPGGANAPAVWVVPLGIIACMLVGTACGALNGLMVVLLRVHPFIITLGTMSIYRGIAFVTTRAQPVTDYPPAFGQIFRGTIADFTWIPLLIMLAVVVAGAVFLQRTVPGRDMFAVGGNELAARLAGVRVGRIKILAFALAGLMGGIAAVIALGVFGSADSSTGRGYELDVIAAAVVGGASLTGGRGSAVGALLGTLVIALIANGIVILEIDQNYTEIIKGAVIVIAVVLDRVSARMGGRVD
ncbi:MAG: ABC transporter permease [Phycisphaerales bacterium]|nr:ABC transporter permease [Phycisphaerales bacterium]